jgi:hypothetical protein
MVVQGGHRAAEAARAEQLFGVKRAVRFSELDVVLSGQLAESVVAWHGWILLRRKCRPKEI